MDYQKDIVINKHALDDECLKQPALFLQYALAAVDAEDMRDKLKRKKEVVYAEVEEAVRTRFDASGEKVTEAKVKAAVTLDSEIEEIEADYLRAVKEAKIFGVAKEAFEQRKKSIEMLCSLYGLGYFSQPKGGAVQDAKASAIQKKLNKES